MLRLSDLREGDVIVADAGFTCIDAGQRCVVRRGEQCTSRDAHGHELSVDCREGFGAHYLAGSLTHDGYLVGFERA